MELVFLYGPAAAGKLTVARELAPLLEARLFHNHLVVDALTAVFDFGSPSFVELRESIWISVFREAARQQRTLVFTFTPERTVRPSFVSDAVEAVESEGGRVVFVELACPFPVLEKRMENRSRAEFGKLRSLEHSGGSSARACSSIPIFPSRCSPWTRADTRRARQRSESRESSTTSPADEPLPRRAAGSR